MPCKISATRGTSLYRQNEQWNNKHAKTPNRKQELQILLQIFYCSKSHHTFYDKINISNYLIANAGV